MLKVAIVGASGFIGTRLTEMLHLGAIATVRPIVRSFANLARLSKFQLDWRIADALDAEALTLAMAGCDMAVHCVAGDASVIMGSMAPFYQAARASGVSRIVYLSSASVHGQAPVEGTDETTPLSDRQPLSYNNAKVLAERELLETHAHGNLEAVILRPGIVMGPRSNRWLIGIADDLISGSAYLIEEGAGICNSIYVDNLVHAIHLSLIADKKEVDGQAFIVGDEEQVTWLDVYRPIAEALAVDVAKIARISKPEFKRTWQDKLDELRASKSAQAILPFIPGRMKRVVKAIVREWRSPDYIDAADFGNQCVSGVLPTEEMCLLQTCAYKLPYTKAASKLSYKPIVSYAEGVRRSIGWLSFAGYDTR
jgi:nucleoside-diphosphate-sugar epimerase